MFQWVIFLYKLQDTITYYHLMLLIEKSNFPFNSEKIWLRMAELLPLYTFNQWQTSLYQLQDGTVLLTSYCTHWVEKLSFLQRKDPTLNGKAMAPVYFQPMRGLVILYWTLSTNNNLAKISCKMAPCTTILL